MATKALLYSADRLTSEKVKESRCKALVRQLLAVEIAKRIYQRVIVKDKYASNEAIKPIKQKAYQHHIEPKIFRVNRREMEELERWAMIAAGR